MKDAITEAARTDWNLLLSNRCGVKTLNKFAIGNVSTKSVSTCFANTDKASEFRKLVRTHGSTYARRLTRKALRYRDLLQGE